METNIGKKVLVRGTNSGVEFGELVAQNGREVTLGNARRIWYRDGAASHLTVRPLSVSSWN